MATPAAEPQPPVTLADIEAAAKRLVAEMKRANEKMESDQREIERLKAHTRATLSRLKAA